MSGGIEYFVAGAGAEALEVEGDVGEAEIFEEVSDLFSGWWIGQFGDFVGGNFDADEVIVVADAEVFETEGAEEFFAGFDLFKFGGTDGLVIGDAAGQAGMSGFVPGGQVEEFAEGADFVFGKFSLFEGAEDIEFFGGLEAGSEIGEVVGVGAAEDGIVAELVGGIAEHLVEMAFAMEAAFGGVTVIERIGHFGGIDFMDFNLEAVGQVESILQFGAGQGFTVTDTGEGIGRADGIGGNFKEQDAIDAAGVGDDDFGELLDNVLEVLEFFN